MCCSDHLHCCPSGTTCDMPKEKCNKGTLSVPWQRKTPAFKAGLNTQKGNTVCPGGGSCPGNSTCCKMPSGKYGCCPYPKVGFYIFCPSSVNGTKSGRSYHTIMYNTIMFNKKVCSFLSYSRTVQSCTKQSLDILII